MKNLELPNGLNFHDCNLLVVNSEVLSDGLQTKHGSDSYFSPSSKQ